MRTTLVRAAAIAITLTGSLGAQTWQQIGTPDQTNSGPYWNNRSFDAVGPQVCNVGGLLTMSGVSDATCKQVLEGRLPSDPPPLTSTNLFLGGPGGSEPGVGGFRFASGLYNFAFESRISGSTTQWGIVTDNGTVFSAATLLAGPVTVSQPFAVWIAQAQPAAGFGTIFTSDRRIGAVAIGARGATVNQQFAVFTNASGMGTSGGLVTDAFGTIITTSGGGRYYLGMEDITNGGRGFPPSQPGNQSDRDYQDIVISLTAVPEPGTLGLMGAGMAGLLVMMRLRRRA